MPSRNFYLNPIHQQRCTDGNLMLGKVRGWYLKVGVFAFPLNNDLLITPAACVAMR